jgi:hypothetical protein
MFNAERQQPNQITRANAGGPTRLQILTHRAGRIDQFCRSALNGKLQYDKWNFGALGALGVPR